MLYVRVICSCYMFVLYVRVICSCYMFVLYVRVICSCYMFVLYVRVICSCYMFVLYVRVICLCYMFVLHMVICSSRFESILSNYIGSIELSLCSNKKLFRVSMFFFKSKLKLMVVLLFIQNSFLQKFNIFMLLYSPQRFSLDVTGQFFGEFHIVSLCIHRCSWQNVCRKQIVSINFHSESVFHWIN